MSNDEANQERTDREILKVFESPNEKIEVAQRSDGAFTYRKRTRNGHTWGPAGPDCGIYDSAASAEAEARARIWWLAAII